MPRQNPLNPFRPIEDKTFVSGKNRADLTGKTIGPYKVIAYSGIRSSHALWRCECLYCGKQYLFRQDSIMRGSVRSCGCCIQTMSPSRQSQLLMTEGNPSLPVPKRVTMNTPEGKKLVWLDDAGIRVGKKHYTPEETVKMGWNCQSKRRSVQALMSSRGYSVISFENSTLSVPLAKPEYEAFLRYCGATNVKPDTYAASILKKWIHRNCKLALSSAPPKR